ncbi:DUF6192 family protein [Streptomyces phaeochromogenes]
MARCTQDAAKRQIGWRVDSPQTPQEKVEAIHDLPADDQVAARVATDFLRRRNVAFRAASDDTARHLLNKAQTDRWHQADEAEPVPGRPESPVAPVVRQLDRTIDFLDLIGACHKFVAATGRLVPQMRGCRLSDDEREVIDKNVDRVRATCERIVTAVDSGHLDMDEELTKLHSRSETPLFSCRCGCRRSPPGTSRSRLPRSAGKQDPMQIVEHPGVDPPLDPPPARHP